MRKLLSQLDFKGVILANVVLCMILNVVVLLFTDHGTFEGFIMCSLAIMTVVLVLLNNSFTYILFILVSAIYSHICYEHGLYGELIVNVIFIMPIQIVGYIHFKEGIVDHDVDIAPISKKYYNLVLVAILLLTYLYSLFLDFLGDPHPSLDAMLTVVQIFATYYMLKGKGIQWLFWVMTNFFALFVWIEVGQRYNLMVMWLFYLLNSLIGVTEYYIGRVKHTHEYATNLSIKKEK